MGTELFAIVFTIAITIATSIPLGRYMARVFSGDRTLLDPVFRPIERLVLGIAGINPNDPAEGQDWKQYSRSLLVSNAVMWLVTWTIVTLQGALPLNPDAIGNMEPTNPDHLKSVRERLNAVIALEGVPANKVPSEMVTASGAGLDPDIPPDAAEIQTARVARARNASVERVRELVRAHTEAPAFGFLGRSRINVLELNLALDASLGKTAAAPASTR